LITQSLEISYNAFSITAFLISAHPKSRLSLAAAVIIFYLSYYVRILYYYSFFFIKLDNDILKGYLQVTNANEPAKFCAIKWVPFNNFFSSGSLEKSFKANCFVVTSAIVTDLAITGGTIY
jgi:hypothetical protein